MTAPETQDALDEFDAVAATPGVRVRVTGPLRHRCPFVDETDEGTVTIEWTTGGGTVELHALAAWLRSLADVKISHEEIATRIRDTVETLPGVDDVTVSVAFATAGLDVTATATPPTS